jgi:hypothetical protein
MRNILPMGMPRPQESNVAVISLLGNENGSETLIFFKRSQNYIKKMSVSAPFLFRSNETSATLEIIWPA